MKNDSINKITDFLFVNKTFDELSNYDLVIVLGNNFYQENANLLKQLFTSNKINNDTLIVLSGNKGLVNNNIIKSEAELIYEKTKELEINLNCIVEPKATNIKENLLFSKTLVGSLEKYNRILLVGKAFASRRILMCADNLGYPIDKLDIYGLEVDIFKTSWYQNKDSKERVLAELERIGKYAIQNDLKI